jgi:hypothetical protein
MDTSHHNPDEILILYEGEISLADSERMFAQIRCMVDAGKLPRSALRVLIEMVQNVRLHGGARGSVVVWDKPGAIFVQTRNKASADAITTVHNMINFINVHAADIIAMMRELRKAEVSPESQGAGLGLMELRRLSGHDIFVSGEAADLFKSELVITVRLDHKSKQ